MTYNERKEMEREDLKRQRDERTALITQYLRDEITGTPYNIEIHGMKDYDDYAMVGYSFSIGNFKQEDEAYWSKDTDEKDLVKRIVDHIVYIESLREKYPDFAAKNDYIQANRKFCKTAKLMHTGYEKVYQPSYELCDLLKLPNTTSCGCGGGDYEIKRTPLRVKDFADNIDRLTNYFLDCISDLRQLKAGLTK